MYVFKTLDVQILFVCFLSKKCRELIVLDFAKRNERVAEKI